MRKRYRVEVNNDGRAIKPFASRLGHVPQCVNKHHAKIYDLSLRENQRPPRGIC